MKCSNTVQFEYTLCYHRHWKTIRYLGRPKKHHGAPNGDFMRRRISAHVMKIFPTKHFNFGWLSLTNFVTLRKPTMVSVFLNLNISYAEITGPALDTMRTCNICKLIRTLFLCTYLACLLDQIYTRDFIVIQALDSCESYECNSTRQKYRF